MYLYLYLYAPVYMDRYTGVGSDGNGRSQAGGGGSSSLDPVYSPSSPIRGTCYQYAIVTERTSTTRNVKICGTDRRQHNVYTSRSNVVEVRFLTSANVDTNKEFYFLLQFEGARRHSNVVASLSQADDDHYLLASTSELHCSVEC